MFSRSMDGLSLVKTTFALKISMDVSPTVFFLAILDVVKKRRENSSLEVFQPLSKQPSMELPV